MVNGIQQLGVNGVLAIDGFQVIHPVNTFTLKNEISSSYSMWVWQDIDTIAKGNCLTGGIKKSRKVCIVMTSDIKNFRVCFIRMELSAGGNHFKLAHKVNTLQSMEF